MVYFALSYVGDFAKEEKTMPFEQLAHTEVLDAQAAETQSDFSEVAISAEQKV